MKKWNLIGSFSHNILERSCSNVTFVTIAVFKFILKHLKNMKEGNLIVYQISQGQLFKIWMVFRCIDSDLWQLNLDHKLKIKGTQRCYSWMYIHVFYQNPQGELFKVWMVFRFVDSDLWQFLLQTQKGHKGFILEWTTFLWFIKIHKVNSSKYELYLNLLTVIFDRQIQLIYVFAKWQVLS